MATLEPRPGFVWSRVRWGGPDEPVSEHCCYCGVPFDDDEVPLRMWIEDFTSAAFCVACTAEWFDIA